MTYVPVTTDRRGAIGHALLAGVVTLLLALHSNAQGVKRGIGGGGIELANAANAGWYYNWGGTPPAEVTSGDFHGDWAPMIWSANAGSIQGKIDTILGYADDLGVTHVLGFNEPDRAEQANMSVPESIALWDVMDDQFVNAGIKLVSPAADQEWMDDFMNQANALNLTVDAVALHWYGTVSTTNPVASANSFLSRVDYWHNRYNKPVWITEFAGMDWGVDDIPSPDLIAANEAFLAVVVPGLESRSHVERYAWWQFGRRDVPGEEADTRLIEQIDGLWTPTGIGDQYVPSYREGEQHNLSGTAPGKTNFYLRGGNLVNTSGPSVTVASIDAIDGNSDFGGTADWRVENGTFRVRSGAVLRKTGSSAVTVSGVSLTNAGLVELLGGTLTLERGALVTGAGSIDVAADAKLSLGAAADRGGVFVNQALELDGGVVQANAIIDGVHTIGGGVMLRSTSTFTGSGTVIVSGPIQSPASGDPGRIVKEGAGAIALTAASSFRGRIDVNGGVLAMTGAASMAAASGFSVGSGGRLDVSGLGAGLTLVSGQSLATKSGAVVQGSVVAGVGASVTADGLHTGSVVAQAGATIDVGDIPTTSQTTTLRFTPPSGAAGSSSDVRVRSGSNANSPQGDTVALGIGSINSSDSFRSLLTFDLSATGIPDPSYIDSVSLTMTLQAPNGAQVNSSSPPVLELLTIAPYNSDSATFNNSPFNSANLVSTTTGPNFASYSAGATIGWSQLESGPFVDAVRGALGGSLHLGARAATISGARSFYFIEQSETATPGAAPSLEIAYSVPSNPIGDATIQGDFTLDPGSTLRIDLQSATSFDQVQVGGAAVLNGVLSVDALDLGQLGVNDTFTILTASSVVNNLTLGGPDGAYFNLSASTPTSLVLTYVGEISLPGDFTSDGVVDAADYSVWRDNLGAPEGSLLNSNGTGGTIDQADYTLWATNYGVTAPLSALGRGVPEPGIGVLCLITLLTQTAVRPRRRWASPRGSAQGEQASPMSQR